MCDHGAASVPVYYIDNLGNFVQFGKERVPKTLFRAKPQRVKRVRRVEVKVWGLDKKRKLEAGEWEMEEQFVTYYESE